MMNCSNCSQLCLKTFMNNFSNWFAICCSWMQICLAKHSAPFVPVFQAINHHNQSLLLLQHLRHPLPRPQLFLQHFQSKNRQCRPLHLPSLPRKLPSQQHPRIRSAEGRLPPPTSPAHFGQRHCPNRADGCGISSGQKCRPMPWLPQPVLRQTFGREWKLLTGN